MKTYRELACLAFVLAAPVLAQEADYGFTLPVTLSAGSMFSQRWQEYSPTAGRFEPGFHSTIDPFLKLGEHWYMYGVIDARVSPYNFFEANFATNRARVALSQGFLAYTRGSNKKSLTIKGGQLSSAFGSFPLRYDDAQNPLVGTPLSYGSADYGAFPVTLYGLGGIEVDGSLDRVDARFQLTNSSPSTPRNLWSGDQHPNWAAGAGYTIRQGFRVGASLQQGPYPNAAPSERPSDDVLRVPIRAVGIDAQWARGRWSVNGEWQRFHYLYPGFVMSPVLKYGYVETKVVINPHLYLAARFGDLTFSQFQAAEMLEPDTVGANRESYEWALGYRINRSQLIKVGYQWLHQDGTLDTKHNILGVQFVTSFNALSKTFR